ncbi:MAG: hypothetical protein Q4D04_04190, partial [Clostridia bacterium]|nr:hypothetical protein [Clostridia bacterium]
MTNRKTRWIGWLLVALFLLAPVSPAIARTLNTGSTQRLLNYPALIASQKNAQAKKILSTWVTPKKATIMKGDMYALPDTVYYKYRNVNDAYYYTVASANENVARITFSGNKPYAYAVGASKVKIIYTLYTYSGSSKKCNFTLTVKAPTVTGVTLSPSS